MKQQSSSPWNVPLANSMYSLNNVVVGLPVSALTGRPY
jgi:hypothetical protein